MFLGINDTAWFKANTAFLKKTRCKTQNLSFNECVFLSVCITVVCEQ